MKNKCASHLVLTGLFVILVLAASNSSVRAQGSPPTTNWIGGTGDWFDPENWSGLLPNPLVAAFINNNGQAQILEGDASAESLTLGDNQGQSGSVTVDGDSANLQMGGTCMGSIYIGNRGSGNLTITNGGVVYNRYAYVAAVANPTRPISNGNVTVTGSASRWRIVDASPLGCSGAGLFIGCTATSDAGGTARVDVSDGAHINVLNRDDASGLPGVKVGLSGTLTGDGYVFLTGTNPIPNPVSVTVRVFGTLAPTSIQGTLGLEQPLTIYGNLDLEPQANMVCHVTPQGWDNVDVKELTHGGVSYGGGQASLGGRLTVIMTGAFTPGLSFTLLHADTGLNDTTFQFESIVYNDPAAPCMTPTITYGANHVYLYLQPCT